MNKLIVINSDAVEKEVDNIDGLTVKWFGNNSIVKVHEKTKFTNCVFEIGSNNTVSIGAGGIVFGLYLRMLASESRVIIGKNFIISGGKFILANYHKNQSLRIGDDCLFSSDIAFFTSDGHTLIDETTGNILNDNGGVIEIGNHVWGGYGICVLKNAQIGDNCMIGAKSLINKEYQVNNAIIAGNPAKIIRTNINWSIKSPEEYKKGIQK